MKEIAELEEMDNTEEKPLKLNYFFSLIFCFLCFVHLYIATIFRVPSELSRKEGIRLFIGFVLLSIVIGYVLHHRSRQNWFRAFCDYLIGMGAYCFFSNFQLKRTLILKHLLIMGILFGVYLLFLTIHTLRLHRPFKEKLFLWLDSSVSIGHLICAFGMLAFMLSMYNRDFFSSGLNEAGTVKPVVSTEATISNSMDVLSNLHSKDWKELTVEEKLDVLQTVANIECNALGLSHELTVVVNDTDETVAGDYSYHQHLITVDTDQLLHTNPYSLVNIICHESYHAYEFALVELYMRSPETYRSLQMFDTIKIYADEFDHYINSSKDHDTYYQQLVEADAREYSEIRTKEYYVSVEKAGEDPT